MKDAPPWTWRCIKRVMDIGGALFALVFLAPIFLCIAVIIRLDTPGSPFFCQVRIGRHGRTFSILKFRTMYIDAEKSTGAVWACAHDPRCTRVGKFLRKTHLDELPQFCNVLLGHMSLVGPRPERPEFTKRLQIISEQYALRHNVKPGMTGLAQVSYPYGASVDDALKKLEYDLYYIKKHSLRLEWRILVRTARLLGSRLG